jgi:hypothetical protein
MDLSLQCFTQTHTVNEDERLVLEVGTTSEHHVPSFAHDAQITVYTGPDTGSYKLPVVEEATLFDDVPLREGEEADEQSEPTPSGPAQGPVRDTVTLVAPSLDLFSAEDVTDAFVEFEVEEDSTMPNSRLLRRRCSRATSTCTCSVGGRGVGDGRQRHDLRPPGESLTTPAPPRVSTACRSRTGRADRTRSTSSSASSTASARSARTDADGKHERGGRSPYRGRPRRSVHLQHHRG